MVTVSPSAPSDSARPTADSRMPGASNSIVTLEPLAVSGIDPSPDMAGVEGNALVSVSFNKAIDPATLPGNFVVRVDGTVLPGGYYVAFVSL